MRYEKLEALLRVALDMRGSAEYKRHLASELTVRTLRTAVERVRNAQAVEGN